MRLLFIRHGDPDYEHDTLTERGCIEAQALSKYIEEWGIDDVYQSPLGRAQKTAEYSLNKLGKSAVTCDWLREFDAAVDLNEHPEWCAAYPDCRRTQDGTRFETRICWDMVPSYMNEHPGYYENPGWRNMDISTQTDMLEKYDKVCSGFDGLMEKYGYYRDGMCYRVEKESTKTIAFFCHHGVTCLLLSHLLNVSPYSMWHGLCLIPTSVTELRTEERQQGTALIRANRVGDIMHLIREKIEPSPAASFAEVYSSETGRH